MQQHHRWQYDYLLGEYRGTSGCSTIHDLDILIYLEVIDHIVMGVLLCRILKLMFWPIFLKISIIPIFLPKFGFDPNGSSLDAQR